MLGNFSTTPETDGIFVIPTAMIKKDGYILAWRFHASKEGPVKLQVGNNYLSIKLIIIEEYWNGNHNCCPNLMNRDCFGRQPATNSTGGSLSWKCY